MNIYDRISKMTDELGTYDEKMYRILTSDKYAYGEYERHKLCEGMEVVNQVIWGWWKPRFLLNHNLKTAYEGGGNGIEDHVETDRAYGQRMPLRIA